MASKKVQNQRHQCSQNHRATRSMNQPFAMVKDAAAKQQRLLLIEDDDPDDEFPTPEPFTKQDLDSFIIETDSISECDNVTSLFSDCISLAGLKCRRDCCRGMFTCEIILNELINIILFIRFTRDIVTTKCFNTNNEYKSTQYYYMSS